MMMVPDAPSEALKPPKSEWHRKLVVQLKDLFSKRPVWARDSLEQQLAIDARGKRDADVPSWATVMETLPHVAFK